MIPLIIFKIIYFVFLYFVLAPSFNINSSFIFLISFVCTLLLQRYFLSEYLDKCQRKENIFCCFLFFLKRPSDAYPNLYNIPSKYLLQLIFFSPVVPFPILKYLPTRLLSSNSNRTLGNPCFLLSKRIPVRMRA